MNIYEKLWAKEGKKILQELQYVVKLKWSEPYIICYITWGVYPYSNPLTLNITTSPTRFIEFLTHELIHRLLSLQNDSVKKGKNWARLMKKYKKYPRLTKTHIIVHAVHEHIIRKFYGEAKLETEKKSVKHRDYILSWRIVERDGYKNIIKELTRGL